MRKLLFLIFTLIIICGYFVIAQTRPSCETPAPFWSPRPTTTQGYVNAICGGGDECYQAWCNYFRPNPGNYQHLDEIPTSYYTQTYTQTSCTGTCKTNTCASYQSCSSATGTCTSGNCCTGSCTTATQTCTQTGGTCKTNTCASYQSCSSVTGTCISGNCCSGSCTTPTTETVNAEELKTVLINAIKDYFSSQTPKLTVNELKDLIVIYLQTSGSTADLSGNGKYTGEKLIDIYNKAKGTTCIPDCTGKCGGFSDGCGGVCSASCGPLGSKTNPIPLSEPAQRISNGYVPPGSGQDLLSHGGWVTSPPHSTLWFVIDPYEVLGKPAQSIALGLKWWAGMPSIHYIQNKATGEYAPGKPPSGLQIYSMDKPYDLDKYGYDLGGKYRFLWAFVNDGDEAKTWSIWATINPYAGNGLPPPSGPLGSKTNPIKLNTPTPKYPNSRYATAASALNEGELVLAPKSKTYFVIDPFTTKGRSVSAFSIQVYTYNDWYTVCKGILQDKITGNLIGGGNEVCRLSSGFVEIVYDNGKPYNVEIDNTRFIYAIENNLGNTAPINVVADISSPIPTPIPTPSGALGSKTNPIKLNKPTSKILNGYIPPTSPDDGRGSITIPANSKVYFEVDPLATTGRSVAAFGVSVKFFSGSGSVCELTQNKITGVYSSESCRWYTSFIKTIYDNKPNEVDDTKFLFAIDNTGVGTAAYDEIWATIAIPTPTPTPTGIPGSKTNPLKLNTPTPDYPTTRYATADSALNGGHLTIAPGAKVYFVIDPLATKGRSVSAFAMQVNTFNDWYITCRGMLQDKLTGNFIMGGDIEDCQQRAGGFSEIIYDNGKPYNVEIDNTRFIYSIENNLNNTGTITIYAEINPSQGTTPAPTPVPTPAPSGPLGSKTNPYKINKPTSRILNGYIPENSPDNSNGLVTIPAGSKVYFEVDPVAIKSVNAFKVGAVFYAGVTVVCKFTQDKTTGSYSPEDCRNYTGVKDIVYDSPTNPISNRKFLYAIDNTLGSGPTNNAIYAEIPFVP